MKNKTFIIVLLILTLLTINFSMAQEVDNSTSDEMILDVDGDVLEASDVNETALQSSSAENTKISVNSTTDFDVVGDYFKVKLTDINGNALKNSKITFTVNGVSYNKNTDSNGVASLQIRLNDGTYTIVSKYGGNSNYKSSSLTTKITMDNTREVASGLSNSEIQKIIDNAKVNNVILFKGSSYSNINLVITKCLTLQSNVNTVLKSNSGPVITIKGKSASLTTVKGFNIQSGGDGISINNADYVKVLNNDITGEGNSIVAVGTKYLNITKNDISKNAKSGIVLADSSYAYIFSNTINKNGKNGIEVAKSEYVYIHGNTISGNSNNGIYLAKKVNGINYGSGAENIYITKNNIRNNGENGIYVLYAGDNIQIKGNSIESNEDSGISITAIGDNTIQSNVIASNAYVGIKFNDDYVKPKNQDISYNAIVGNAHREVEAKETYYSENGQQLDVGENWYGGSGVICPKIKTSNLRFVVSQVGSNKFQASFIDSNGNVAGLLPDRTLTYWTNGQKVTMTISGGIATFTVDASDGDIVKAVVDNSRVNNVYDSNTKESSSDVNGHPVSYDYESIPYYQLYEDIGKGSGDGSGDGSSGASNAGNGNSNQQSSDNAGNGTHSQKQDPASNSNNQVNDVSQSYETEVTTSQAGASEAGSGESSPEAQSQSVVKQILIDEDEFFKVTGISFIILLIILTVGLYYRKDIYEMKSKM